MMQQIPIVMKQYDPKERYFGYHFIHYFTILDSKRSIEEDITKLEEVRKSLLGKIKSANIEIDLDDLAKVYEVRDQLDSRLDQISENVHQKWEEIRIGRWRPWTSISSSAEHRERRPEGYTVGYQFPERYKIKLEQFSSPETGYNITEENRLRYEAAKKVMDELGLNHKGWLQNLPTTDGLYLIYSFNSINEAIDTTKQYLSKFPKDE